MLTAMDDLLRKTLEVGHSLDLG